MNTAQKALHVMGVTLALACVPALVCHASDEPELSSAIRQKNIVRVRLLLSEGSGVNDRDEGAQQTPLMRAAQMGDLSIARTLIAYGADVNAQDDEGHTALMFAAEKGSTGMVDALLRAGAKGGLRDRAGETALTFAQRSQHTALAKRLRATRQDIAAKPAVQSVRHDIAANR